MKRCRRPFTLIEVMVVISLIALVIGTIGVMGYRLVQHERFRSSVDIAGDQLQLAQDLMLILDADTTFWIDQDFNSKLFSCGVSTDKPLPKGFSRFVNQPYALEGISAVTFAETKGFAQPISELQLRFFSKGSVMDSGILRFQKNAQESDDDVAIQLAGFPRKIEVGTSIQPFDPVQESSRWYPQEVLTLATPSDATSGSSDSDLSHRPNDSPFVDPAG